ncbi:MAG: hypothetical protein RR232_02370 [Clostridia bacterium]
MKKLFLAGRVLCLILFFTAIIAWIVSGAWFYLVIFLTLHLIELILAGLRIGSQHGKDILYSFIATMLFGFCWWFALDKGYID